MMNIRISPAVPHLGGIKVGDAPLEAPSIGIAILME